MAETWKPISGFEDLYEVSDLGRVRSLDRIQSSYGGRTWLRKGRLMKLTTVKDQGYIVVTLSLNGFRLRPYVHELVLTAFKGVRPNPSSHGCHNDGDPANNVLGNLRWDTPVGNMSDRVVHGTALVGEQHPLAKVTAEQVALAKRLLVDDPGIKLKDVESMTGVSVGTLNHIKHGRQWKDVQALAV